MGGVAEHAGAGGALLRRDSLFVRIPSGASAIAGMEFAGADCLDDFVPRSTRSESLRRATGGHAASVPCHPGFDNGSVNEIL